MKVTNVSGLPDIIETWAKHDPYKRGNADFTTTELIKPPRMLALERRHADELEVDAAELVWRLSGQAKHYIFQRIAEEDPKRYISEERYTMAVAGIVLSGQGDLIDKKAPETLYDYKETKVWKEILGDAEEWTAQANINAFLVRNIANIYIKRLVNIVIFKDWSVRKASQDATYPQLPIKAWPLELWDLNKTLHYIQQRVSLHKSIGNGTLPLCSPEERWQRPSRWAVMKRGRATAVKLFDTQLEANAFIAEASDFKVLSVEERPSEDTRCRFYCDVRKVCDHGRAVLGLGK